MTTLSPTRRSSDLQNPANPARGDSPRPGAQARNHLRAARLLRPAGRLSAAPSASIDPDIHRLDHGGPLVEFAADEVAQLGGRAGGRHGRSEEHTSELQSLMRHSYAVFCLKK